MKCSAQVDLVRAQPGANAIVIRIARIEKGYERSGIEQPDFHSRQFLSLI